MQGSDVVRLITLAAIWGSSFLFMKILAPVMGAVLTADIRVSIAGIILVLYCAAIRFDINWRENWRHYLIIGAINSAIPFYLFSFAALHIPASYSVIINSTSPFFGAVLSAIWLGEAFTSTKLLGLGMGAFGVSMVTHLSKHEMDPYFAKSIIACFIAAALYAVCGVYMRKFSSHLKPLATAGASQVIAGLLLLIALPFSPPIGEISSKIMVIACVFSVLCSAIAYLLYYKLVADIGPTKALTVTFLTPMFGMVWASLFLGEPITIRMVTGSLIIIAGAALVLKKTTKAHSDSSTTHERI